jgi:hypothetical protein
VQTVDEEGHAQNQWDQVDDFKWLKAEQSPHWNILGEEARVKDEIWKGVVAEYTGLSIEDILKAVTGQ